MNEPFAATRLVRGTWRTALLVALHLVMAPGVPAADDKTPAAAETELAPAKLAEVDKFMERQVGDKKIAGGIVMISHRGKTWLHTYGKMDIEADKPMKPDTIVRLYSMSKSITTAAALTLFEAGKLGLDDPVSKYIPSFENLKVAAPEGLRAPSRPPTVRDLMLHTSGLTYGSGPDAVKAAYEKLKPMESANLKEMAEKLSQAPLAFDPGSDWTYSTAIDVLGRVIEVASDESLDTFLHKTIFKPLDMPDTSFAVPADKLPRFAACYKRTSDGLKVTDPPAKSKFAKAVTLFSGGGGLVGTAGDYMRFLTMIQNGGTLGGHRILRRHRKADDLESTSQEGVSDSFRQGDSTRNGFWAGIFGTHGNYGLGSRGSRRRIWLGWRRIDALLGQPRRRSDRRHARANHAV